MKFYGQYASDNNLLDSLLGNSISQFWRNGWEMYEDTHVDIDNYLSEKLFLYMDYATQGRINIRNLFNYAKAHAD